FPSRCSEFKQLTESGDRPSHPCSRASATHAAPRDNAGHTLIEPSGFLRSSHGQPKNLLILWTAFEGAAAEKVSDSAG
ncbi:hypothetical protein, partial [Acinetobacter baumannii]|uniref:hypothetical protein n=1 Tax=Acinetobacter baumannii TaxID=470 RepID=UPI001C086D10